MPDDTATEDQAAQLEEAFARLQADYGVTDDADDTDSLDTQTQDADGALTDEAPETDSSDEAEDTDATTDASDLIDLGDGTTISRDRLAELHRLSQFLDGDSSPLAGLQDTAQLIQQAQQSAPAVPTPAESVAQQTPTPQIPEAIANDPDLKFLWDNQMAIAQENQTLRAHLLQQQQIELASNVERAITDWNAKYKLDDATLSSLRENVAKSNVAYALEQSGKSTYDAVVGGLEAAFWSNQDLRTAYLTAESQTNKTQAVKDQNKKQKLSALSGRGSSAPTHKAPREMTREERNQAMIAEISEHLSSH